MPKETKHKLSEVITFGEALIRTEDLDPVYCTLYRAKLPKDQLYRLLLAYFCFYQLGAAAYISEYEGSEFWDVMAQAAENQMPPSGTDSALTQDRWPRGAERRHFRGQKCEDAVEYLAKLPMAPERVVQQLADPGRTVQLSEVIYQVQSFPLFGPWIAFKVADTLERVLRAPIVFPDDLTLMYKEPRAALDMLDIPAEEANRKLLKYFARLLAPPYVGRRCNIQEVETICCKWKSSVGGHYYVGKDIHEIRRGLKGWGKTAERLLGFMPAEVQQGLFK